MLEKCLKLHRLRKELVQIFILICKREKLVNRDIKRFLYLNYLNNIQQHFLVVLIQELKRIDKNLIEKIKQAQDRYEEIRNSFIINGIV